MPATIPMLVYMDPRQSHGTSSTRPAAVAGTFYPAEPAILRDTVAALLAATPPAPRTGPPPKALIVPHAGYVYSGPTAALAYARLAPFAATITRVALFGPAHRVAFRGLALPGARAFETPLGNVEIDAAAVAAALGLPEVFEEPRAHAAEHSLEVQLPFLQQVLRRFTLVPFVVGQASAETVAAVIDSLWGGPETLIVISSDLSHFHRHADAQAIDRQSCDAILAGRPALDHEQACGATPVNGLALAARRHGLVPTLIDLRNSSDTAGDRGRVVGYAAFTYSTAAAESHAPH